MKKLFTITLSIAAAAVFIFTGNGCTEKKTIKKKFSHVYQHEFSVADSNNTSFNLQGILDASSFADFDKNKSELIDFTVDSILYYVYELNNDWTLTDSIVGASFKVADVNNTSDMTLGEVGGVNLNSNFGESNARKLTVDNGGIDKFISVMMNNPHKGWLKFNGAVSSVPVDFKIRVKVYVTFNAWIL